MQEQQRGAAPPWARRDPGTARAAGVHRLCLSDRCVQGCVGVTWAGTAARQSCPATRHSCKGREIDHGWAESGHCLPGSAREAGAFPALPRCVALSA